MAEAIISRFGSVSEELIESVIEKYTESMMPGSSLFTENTTFTVPKNSQYEVIMIGGGGGGGGHASSRSFLSDQYSAYGAGGGSGYLTWQNVNLTRNEYVNIIIGDGGNAGWNDIRQSSSGWVNAGDGGTGGTTFLGDYLSANGGTGGGGGKTYRPGEGTTNYKYGGTAGTGYYSGTAGNTGLGGNGILPPHNLNTDTGWGKGGNISIAGTKGCIWISWY